MQGVVFDETSLIGVDMHQGHVDFVSTPHKLLPMLRRC
jgi:hypothetical protein